MVRMGAIGRAYWGKPCITTDYEWVGSVEGAKKAHAVKLSHGLFTLYIYIATYTVTVLKLIANYLVKSLKILFLYYIYIQVMYKHKY